jgi:hypothetical protein
VEYRVGYGPFLRLFAYVRGTQISKLDTDTIKRWSFDDTIPWPDSRAVVNRNEYCGVQSWIWTIFETICLCAGVHKSQNWFPVPIPVHLCSTIPGIRACRLVGFGMRRVGVQGLGFRV